MRASEAGRKSPSLDTLACIVRAAGQDLRIRLERLDDHDEWVAAYDRVAWEVPARRASFRWDSPESWRASLSHLRARKGRGNAVVVSDAP